jgi:hypothetical protein
MAGVLATRLRKAPPSNGLGLFSWHLALDLCGLFNSILNGGIFMASSTFDSAVSKIDAAKQMREQRKTDINARQTKAQEDFRQSLYIFPALQAQIEAFKAELASMGWDSSLSVKWDYSGYDKVLSWTATATFKVKADKIPEFATGVMDGCVTGRLIYRLTSHTIDVQVSVEPTVVFRDPDEIMLMPEPLQLTNLGDAVEAVWTLQTDLLAHVLYHFKER